MPVMSRYCKAYLLQAFREYSEWKPLPLADDLTDEIVVYLHDSFIVTKGVFVDEDILFDSKDESWIRFCQQHLEFAPPDT